MTTKTRKPKTTTRLALDYDTELANLLSGNAHVLIGQRTCAADMTSHNGFVYPVRGWAACDDWDNANECGNGLHFCAVGAVGGDAQNDSGSTIIADGNDRRWQIVLAFASECVHIDEEKHKAPRLFVVDTDGTRDAMNAWLVAYGIDGHYCTITASGYGGQATASGYRGQATASGDGGQATASGDGGQATAGNHGSAFVRNNSYAKTGNNGVIVTTWFDYNNSQQVKAWTVGENRELKADTLYFLKDGVATEHVS
ncbi:hypothetical protein [Casimicrobium huifangae]|uniref:DUF7666 domain-containing protein n=1 Tax=Casimicrobium huifangae TaxID=2591109 RepID=UPI00378498DB